MIIIIDGLEKTGKTTLAKEIYSEINIISGGEFANLNYIDLYNDINPEKVQDSLMKIIGRSDSKGESFIIDGGHISFKSKPEFEDFLDFYVIDSWLANSKSFLIYLTSTIDTIIGRSSKHTIEDKLNLINQHNKAGNLFSISNIEIKGSFLIEQFLSVENGLGKKAQYFKIIQSIYNIYG